jgi:hypothetical protein
MRFDYSDKVVDTVREIVAVYSENCTKSAHSLRKFRYSCLSRFDVRSNHCALNGYNLMPHFVIQF